MQSKKNKKANIFLVILGYFCINFSSFSSQNTTYVGSEKSKGLLEPVKELDLGHTLFSQDSWTLEASTGAFFDAGATKNSNAHDSKLTPKITQTGAGVRFGHAFTQEWTGFAGLGVDYASCHDQNKKENNDNETQEWAFIPEIGVKGQGDHVKWLASFGYKIGINKNRESPSSPQPYYRSPEMVARVGFSYTF